MQYAVGKSPIFIGGAPRSGTTLLRAMVNARVAEKTPANILHFSRLRQIFPDSPLIGIVRDGRDVVASLLSMDWTDARTGQPMAITRDAEAAAQLWCASIDAGQRMQADPNYFELRYEDLVADTAGTISRLFDALGEDDDAKARALDHADAFDGRQGMAESSADRVSRPVDRTAIDRWQTDLDQTRLDTVMRVAGHHLDRLGYV